MSLKKRFLLGTASAIVSLAVLVGLDQLYPPDLTRFEEASRELRSESGELLHVYQTKDDKWRLSARFNEIDPLYINMLIAREDRFFWGHFGVNPLALCRATGQWLSRGKIVSGGSTLTMQVARLLEPQPRTTKAKILQIIRAVQLELRYSKREILEIYLTLAPYGSNLEGARSAAYAYFGKPADRLQPSEAALLVALPQAPSLWSRAGFSPSTQDARNRVLALAYEKGLIDESTFQVAMKEPLPNSHFTLPREIPHLARRLCTTSQSPPVSYCSIQPKLQKSTESIVFETGKLLPPEVNIAILVVHHPTRKVVSYVGSSDFFDSSRKGQVDFIRAYRSPGSTLKPFIYGLGFDYGMIKPSTYMLDDRHRFGSYVPDNFDKSFHGMVTVSEALSLSLNVPVVELLREIGPRRFLGSLEEVGIKPKFSDSLTSPGLSLALGGVGMTLEQLVTIYASLPQNGQILPLTYSPEMNVQQPIQFLTQKSTEQITDILSQNTGNIALKTGTSYGHRDAWAVGYNGEYVVGVWIGRPNGSPFGLGTGGTLAVPVLQKIFKFLPTTEKLNKGSKQNDGLKLLEHPDKLQSKEKVLHKQAPQMLFPVDATVIESFNEECSSPIMLTVAGGKRPYTWFVDGKPIAINVWNPKLPWKPVKPGFYKVSLIDAQGFSESANVEVQ